MAISFRKPRDPYYADALFSAMKILSKTASALFHDRGDSPEWGLLIHARMYLEKQHERLFRETIGEGDGK